MKPRVFLTAAAAIVFVLKLQPCASFNALMVPLNINSHLLSYGRLGAALSQEGHQITILTSSNTRTPGWIYNSNVQVLKYKSSGNISYANSDKMNKMAVQVGMSSSIFELVAIRNKVWPELYNAFNQDGIDILEDRALMKQLQVLNFDIAIVDPSFWTNLYVVPYSLDIPYASYSNYFTTWVYGVPDLPSFSPHVTNDQSDEMDFIARMKNIFLHLAELSFHNQSTYYTRRYTPRKPALSNLELFRKSCLWFFLDDITVSYPRPSMPNTFSVGDVIPQPGAPLPHELDTLLEKAEGGAILVSFGSYLEHIPQESAKALCDVFAHNNYTVIWKHTDKDLCNRFGFDMVNIRIMTWVPQNDILAHPNLRLFVTHCGTNSVLESVYHGKPMIGVPIYLDQPLNAEAVKRLGYGLVLNIFALTSRDLSEAIDEVLMKPEYTQRVRNASEILKCKPETAGKRAAFWLDHVIKYGDEHLRSKNMKLGFLQFFMFDLVLSVALVLITMLFTVCLLLYCCWRLYRRDRLKLKSKME